MAAAQAWAELAAVVGTELEAWRQAHPRATLAEIEAAVQTTLQQLQARLLTDLVAASPSADLAATPPAERPRCPDCGGTLQPRGRRTRQVLTPGQLAPLRLERSYAVCSACGHGLFPPRRRTGARARGV
jgi:hypothetical protein